MNYFSVIMDGIEIFNPEYKEMSLDGAVCTSGVGEAGNMDFTFPTDHVFEKSLVPYGSTIEVFEDGVSVFYGRPLPPTIDILGRKKIHCEGALAFLGDVVCPPGVMGLSLEMDDGQYYAFLITYYNSNQNRSDRRLVMGAAPSGGVSRKREWTFRSCLDELRNNILPYVGGFVYTRREGNLTYIEWTTDFTQTATQPVALGLNLVDITRAGRQFYTAAIAKGAGDVYMTEPVELGAAILQKYGFICASLDYPSVGTVEALQAKCVSFLSEQQFNGMDFTIDALDLHIFGKHAMLKVGQIVTVRFSELEDPVNIPIRSIQTNLNTGIKKITVAFPADVELRSYTKANTISGLSADGFVVQDINSQNIDWINSQIPDWADVINPTGQYHYFIDEFGNTIAEHLEIVEVIDPETGETVETYEPVFEKIPDSIDIIPNPNNPPPDAYLPGDQFDPSQYQVEMHYGDGTIEVTDVDPNGFNIPDGYEFQGDGLDPSSLDYTSPMGGVPLSASTGLTVQNTLPESIEIITPPTKTVYQDGETIDLTGIVVVAKNAHGNIWTSEQYPDGIIPIEELTCVPSVVNADTYYMGDILWVDAKDIHLRQQNITDYYVNQNYNQFTRTADFNGTISFKNVKCVALILRYNRTSYENDSWDKETGSSMDIFAFVDVKKTRYQEGEDGIEITGAASVSFENTPNRFEEFTAPHFKPYSATVDFSSKNTHSLNGGDFFYFTLWPDRCGVNCFGVGTSPIAEPSSWSTWTHESIAGNTINTRSAKYKLICDAPVNLNNKSDYDILGEFLDSEKTHTVISWNRPQDNNTLSTSLDITLSET